MIQGPFSVGEWFGSTALAIAMTSVLTGCASEPTAPPVQTPTTQITAASQTASTKPAKAAKPAKEPKSAVSDMEAAIEAGKEACAPLGETYAKEKWRAVNQRGVWRVWVTPVHCDGGGTCPTYEVHVTASDGTAGVCTQRIATY